MISCMQTPSTSYSKNCSNIFWMKTAPQVLESLRSALRITVYISCFKLSPVKGLNKMSQSTMPYNSLAGEGAALTIVKKSCLIKNEFAETWRLGAMHNNLCAGWAGTPYHYVCCVGLSGFQKLQLLGDRRKGRGQKGASKTFITAGSGASSQHITCN